ncbi:PilW family protein [Massilia sp. SR12]
MQRLQKGFGLVEIMVGLLVGMISMVIVLQVFQNAEGRKRNVTTGADAQSSGAIALYMIENDARMAGWGMSPSQSADCKKLYSYCDGSPACGGVEGPINGLNFAPLLLTDGADGGPDTVAVQYFADPENGSFQMPSKVKLSRSMPQPSAVIDVNSVSGCEEGDMIMLRQPGICTLGNITELLDQGEKPKIQHNPGKNGMFNPPASYQNDHNWPKYGKGSSVTCFKPTGVSATFSKSYAIDLATRRLERSDNGQAPELVMADILDLQAQYGVANAGQQNVTEWVDADAAPWKSPGANDWPRIKAIRVVVVARANQYERAKDDSGKCTTTTMKDGKVKGWPEWTTYNAEKYPADWGCYRYRVFETVVPLRNVIWSEI